MLLCFLQSSLPTGVVWTSRPTRPKRQSFRAAFYYSTPGLQRQSSDGLLHWCDVNPGGGQEFSTQPFPPGSALNGWSQGVVVKRRFTGSNYGGFGGRKREISRAAPPLWSSVCVFFHYMLFYTSFYVISSILVLVMIWKKQTTVVHGASPPKKRNDVFTWTTLRPRKLPNLTMHQPRKKREEECTTIFSRWGEPTK